MTQFNHKNTRVWRCRARTFFCGPRTLVAGVLNVTPDSFSDGGRYVDPRRAVERACAMAEAGADLLDVGGESSRPGSAPVPYEVELERVLPVIEGIRTVSDIPLSIDTTKAVVARRALDRGVEIVNDITALRGDPEMAEVVAEFEAGLVLMHMLGGPRTMQDRPSYEDVVGEVEEFFEERIEAALAAGIERDCLCLDPGIGFGKRLEDNLALIAACRRFRRLGAPVLLGMSRKSFIGELLDTPIDERLEGSLAAAVAGVLHGADIVRVHDVAETRKALAVADALKGRLFD